jgi:transcriptional regulator with XRE-family HTH domain
MSRKATPDRVLAGILRRMREERGITCEALALRSGITVSALSRIELARTTPRWDTVRLLARALDVTMVELSAAVEGSHPGDLPAGAWRSRPIRPAGRGA